GTAAHQRCSVSVGGGPLLSFTANRRGSIPGALYREQPPRDRIKKPSISIGSGCARSQAHFFHALAARASGSCSCCDRTVPFVIYGTAGKVRSSADLRTCTKR